MANLISKITLAIIISTSTYYVIYTKETKDPISNSPIEKIPGKSKKISSAIRKRKSSGIKKKPLTIMQMPEDELVQLQKNAALERDFPLAIKCLERRMKLNTNPETLANLIFELGQLQFEFNKLEPCIKTLNEFKKKFPGHIEIEEAHYKVCVASFLNTLGSEKDQTNTDIAINLANEYLDHPTNFKKYRSEVETLKQQTLKQKATHELMICESHIKTGHLAGAKRRLAYLEQEFSNIPEINSQVLALHEKVYSHKKNIS
ncbi:outer membrane protein assembly factor BamD [Candidatus Dependentiae bacterium]|nr:MAG: outer membrane protein assembly factor BamD [Candidatus Dependentiae bacterium]